MHLCANISMLFTEAPMPARFALARAAGFDAVEIQFPDEADLGALVAARDAAGVPVRLVNVPRGGPGEAGLAALPGRQAEFRAAVETGMRCAQALGAGLVNVLAGFARGAAPADAAETFAGNLAHAASRFAEIGARVLTEPVNGVDRPGFHLTGLDAGLDAIAAAGHPNLALQFDLYHMAITEPDLPAAIARAGAAIGHVQFADAPGRHEPGTGTTDFAAAIATLRAVGYDGALSAEYVPAGDTRAGLEWMEEETWRT